MVWHFGALIGAVAFASAMIVAKEGIVALVSVPLGTTLLMTLGAVEAMKIANRRAQLRIARGELDDYHAVGSPDASPLVAPGATPDGAPLSSP